MRVTENVDFGFYNSNTAKRGIIVAYLNASSSNNYKTTITKSKQEARKRSEEETKIQAQSKTPRTLKFTTGVVSVKAFLVLLSVFAP